MVKAFIDTNILLDFLLPGREKHADARAIFNLIEEHRIEALMTTQSLLDAAFIGRNGNPGFLPVFRNTMLHFLQRTNVTAIDTFQLEDALRDPSPDLEDSAQISCALGECCDIFLTNDRGILSRTFPSPMQAMTAGDLLDRCRA